MLIRSVVIDARIGLCKPNARRAGTVPASGARATGPCREAALTRSFDPGSLIDDFRDEARDQVDRLDAGLLRIERQGTLEEGARRELLRSLHTLKGNAGMLGLSGIGDLVHVVETVVKAGPVGWSEPVVEALFAGATALRRAVESVGGAGEAEAMRHLRWARHRLEAEGGEDGGQAVPPSEPVSSGEAEPAGEDRLRVPFAQLDALLNQVGELVGEVESLVHAVAEAPRAVARERAESVERRVHRLQETVMTLRLVPLERVLGRFHGLVRRLAREQGKEARLVVEGESTELDKSTADALAEPLLHLVRNAVDHGIEPPEVREAAGKPRHGTLRITAVRTGDRVRIEVADDGGGVDLDAVRSRAAAAGLVPEAAAVADEEAEALIFLPGLSTRADVDTVSGRGIGLDVVRRSVRRLRGELVLGRPREGGTFFTLSLPLAVAVVPCLVFEAGGEPLAVPTTAVTRALLLAGVERVGATEVVREDGRVLPVVDPDRLFGWPPSPRGPVGVLLRWGREGVVVRAQRLLYQRDLLVRSLPPYGSRPPGVSGASILPGGKVILVLDPAEVIELTAARGKELAR
jgi:two-component system, chemotaxis family, sensor kinase CheA